MKFKCGLTIAERCEKYKREREEFLKNNVWKPWFAWYPVTVEDEHCRWLETVYRRKSYTDLKYCVIINDWKYRTKPDDL